MSNKERSILFGTFILLITLSFSAGCITRSRTPRVSHGAMLTPLTNPDFEEGRADENPLGWRFGIRPAGGYMTRTVAASCYWGKQCAIVQSAAGPRPPDSLAFLHQIIDASAYRGKKFAFRAAVRADVSGAPNVARLLIRVHRNNGESSFFDNMGDRPITLKRWARYEIRGTISSDAHDIELGMQLVGIGAAWLDAASLNFSN